VNRTLKQNIELLSDEDILYKLSNSYFSEEAAKIAEQVMHERGMSEKDLQSAVETSTNEEVIAYTEEEFVELWKSKLAGANKIFLTLTIAYGIQNLAKLTFNFRFGWVLIILNFAVSYFAARRLLWSILDSNKTEEISSKRTFLWIFGITFILKS